MALHDRMNKAELDEFNQKLNTLWDEADQAEETPDEDKDVTTYPGFADGGVIPREIDGQDYTDYDAPTD